MSKKVVVRLEIIASDQDEIQEIVFDLNNGRVLRMKQVKPDCYGDSWIHSDDPCKCKYSRGHLLQSLLELAYTHGEIQ